MARLEDMHVDIEVVQGPDAVRMALIRSANDLVKELAGTCESKGEQDTYYAALAFLQMQYESERTFLYHKEPK